MNESASSPNPDPNEGLSVDGVAIGDQTKRRTAGVADSTMALPFQSILFAASTNAFRTEVRAAPDYFYDLHLDQMFAEISVERQDYDLAPFFNGRLRDEDTIRYRQEVFRDLDRPAVFSAMATFAQALHDMHGSLAQTSTIHDIYQRECWFLDTIGLYTNAITSLAASLAEVELNSGGLIGFRDYLVDYGRSQAFLALVAETDLVKGGFSGLEYTIQINGARCTVARCDSEADYSSEVLRTFERFKQGSVKDYRVGFRESIEMNHVEANVVGLVAKLYPEQFVALDNYFSCHQDFFDPIIRRFEREVQFYLSYLEYLNRFRIAGLSFCYPHVTRRTKEIFAVDTFDIALASKLTSERATVVTNDFFLKGAERIFVVSGPNQGGKTTFARMLGQLHHLACIGYLVPGTEANLYLYDQLFVQFEREENLENRTGKLEDELVRIKDTLAKVTPDSIVVLNEIFASTTMQDAVFLGTKVMDRLIELDVLGVFVTFVEELASLAPSTVSMVSTIVPDDPLERTYKVIRRQADGLAYAFAIAEKFGVTYEDLKRRVLS